MNKTRPNRVYFRVTDTELELINDSVKASGMTRQDWLLNKVMKIIKKRYRHQRWQGIKMI